MFHQHQYWLHRVMRAIIHPIIAIMVAIRQGDRRHRSDNNSSDEDHRHHKNNNSNEDDHRHHKNNIGHLRHKGAPAIMVVKIMMLKWVHHDVVQGIRNHLCQGHHRQVNQGVVVAAARRDWKELLNLSRHATPRHKKQKWVWGAMG